MAVLMGRDGLRTVAAALLALLELAARWEEGR